MPSPQLVEHVLGEPTHDQPLSTVHAALQPSPFSLGGASSHASAPTLMPSPQLVEHVLGVPTHDQPLSVVHVALQPSLSVLLSSSHCSPPTLMPSPQVDV